MIKSGYREGLYLGDGFNAVLPEIEGQITALLRENHGVGIIGGYYGPGYPLCMVSELAMQLLGYSSDEEFERVTGGSMGGLVYEGDGFLEELFSEPEGVFEHYLRGQSGRRWVRMVKREMLLPSGERLWLVSVCDIDALEHALSETALNTEVISAIGKLYWLIYRLDLETGTFEEVSARGERHRLTGDSGVTAERFPEACRATVAPDYLDIMLEFLDTSTLRERLRDRDEISRDYRTRTGNWHMGRFIVQKRAADGRVTRVLYTIQIINEQKQRELEYEHRLTETAEEAQRASLSKTDFLRRMSHDIRTPINGIRGMIEIANHCADDLEKQRECRDKIWEASGYLLSLVNSVLDMNKLESGSVVLENEPFDLLDLLGEVNTIAEMQANERGLRYIVDEKNQQIIHRRLIGSAPHIKQVLMNLAGNAVKYNREGGSVRVWCRELTCAGGMATFQFVCSDTGIGMSPEFQSRAFEPFAQEGRNIARTRYDGTGLGLSIVHSLVGQMGGSITFSSEENVGTEFVVTLPLTVDDAPQAVRRETVDASAVDLSGINILLAEDNELNMEIAQFFLERHGAAVTQAKNGAEAVELFLTSAPGHFDIILMDVMMPVLSGYDATGVIRRAQRPDAATVPIIAMSANAFQDDIRKSRAVGMNDHLPKPVSTEKLLRTVARYLKR